MSLVASHQRLPRYLSQSELHAFLRAITSLRDRLLFALIYHYGLRVGEVELLQRRDVDLPRGRIVIKRLKGGYWSERPLFGTTTSVLRHFLAEQVSTANAPLFTGRSGPLRKRQIQMLFCRYRDRARLSRQYTCHGLRHSIATHLLDAGVSLEFVQDHLGHQSIRSTSIYARITDRHRAERYRELESSPWIVQPAIPDYLPPPDEGAAP